MTKHPCPKDPPSTCTAFVAINYGWLRKHIIISQKGQSPSCHGSGFSHFEPPNPLFVLAKDNHSHIRILDILFFTRLILGILFFLNNTPIQLAVKPRARTSPKGLENNRLRSIVRWRRGLRGGNKSSKLTQKKPPLFFCEFV